MKETDKQKFDKIFSIIMRAALSAAAVGGATAMLIKYEYFSQLSQVDNVVGALPILLAVVFAGGFCALLWIKYDEKYKLLFMALCVLSALSVALFPNAVVGNWWIGKASMYKGEQPDITKYAPFTDGTLAVRPDGECAPILDKDLPVLDGALALYPVYSAIAQTAYAESAYNQNPESVVFTDTLRAYDGIIDGTRDVIFVAGAAASQMKRAQEKGVELVFTPIGKEAFVFLVGKTNPTDNITTQQIKNVYSGKTSRWETLGWKKGGDILAFQRPDGSGSQTGLQQIMKELPVMAPRPAPSNDIIGTNSLMKQISVEYNGVQPALGYSYRFYAQTMWTNPDSKILSVDGVYPTDDNIKSGAYPFSVQFYAVTNGQPTGNVAKLLEFVLSPTGQSIIQKSGYAPV